MNHPSDQQWMEFVYNELPGGQRAAFEQHLKSCAACSAKKTAYHRTAKQLDSWRVEIPEKPSLPTTWSPAVKWAAAAALLVTTALATGRLSAPSFDSEKIQAQITQPLQEKITRDIQSKIQQEAQVAAEHALDAVRQKLQADLAAHIEAITEKTLANAAADKEQFSLALSTLRDQNNALYTVLRNIETKRQNDYHAMRQDLEKVAVYTDQSLRSAQRELVQLASLNQPAQQ